ncbi:MAG TPA: excinuclease ABC subunit UvrC [Candidatus Thermoplasmatota archaeon]|nr:excinuclease ABC subunit UvrC [Candidatus Thermoplasmatota archaeon]
MIALDPADYPEEPGVYLFKDADGRVLYVGKSANLRARLSQYKPGEVEVRKEGLLARAATVDVILTATEKEALLLESALIKKEKPRYNVRLTDDKRYPYLHLTADDYPRIRVVRDVPPAGATFGPFPDAGAARKTLQVVREVFRIRDCKELIPGGCLSYQLALCWGPCIKEAAERRAKAPDKEPDLATSEPDAAYARAAADATRFLKGDTTAISRSLTREMEEASRSEAFERAALFRDRLRAVTSTLARQAVFSKSVDDFDAFVVVREGGLAVGVVTLSRGGRVVGQEHFFFRRGSADKPEAELVGEFVRRYYENLPAIPPTLVVEVVLPDAAAIEAVLAERRGGRVSIEAPHRGDKRRVLDLARKNAAFKLGSERLKRGEVEHAEELADLARALGLASPPKVIECFDISHLGGAGVVASLVVLVDGSPAKSRYRTFKVREDRNDDYAAMREVVERRYARVLKEASALPDLVLIDGGVGQLKAAKDALDALGLASLPVVALAKREEELWLPGRVRPVDLPRSAPGLQPAMRARDEAHRFALRYQRRLRAKALTQSALDGIEGVGPAKKRVLLAHFGSVEAVREAREEDLARVPGVSRALARRIREALGA